MEIHAKRYTLSISTSTKYDENKITMIKSFDRNFLNKHRWKIWTEKYAANTEKQKDENKWKKNWIKSGRTWIRSQQYSHLYFYYSQYSIVAIGTV